MLKNNRIKNKSPRGIELEDYLFSVSKEDSASIEYPLERKKITFLWFIILFFLAVLGIKIFYLNLIKGNYYQEIAEENSLRSIPIKAPRGKIIDRFGNLLVNNIPSVDAVATPLDLSRDPSQLKETLTELSQILSVNEGELVAKITSTDSSSTNPILIKENISQEEYLILEEKKSIFPGIKTEKTAIRQYADSLIFSHVLGYVGKVNKKDLEENEDYLFTDYIGKQGIEKSYEDHLKGRNGAIKAEVDSLGNVKKERGIVSPESGEDLILGIDYELQKKVYDELSDVLEKTDTKTAAAVAIDPKNGEIRALVSLPSFDNNLFSGKISQDDYLKLIENPAKPLFNRAISGEYPPGSTIKPLIALAGLSEGIIDESTSINCSGGINVGDYHFGDWKTHGVVDLKKAIAESCDVFFYSLGGGYGNIEGLGIDNMKKYEDMFGLGSKLGIDIPGESSGFIPSKEWKFQKFDEKWYMGNDYHAAIGQGFVTTTPLQIANYIAAIANGGTLYQPKIVSKIIKSNQEIINNSSVIIKNNFISPQAVKIVQEGMRQTVVSGTAQSLNFPNVSVAGKTGTAQFGSENKTHAWFVSYAPFEDPEIAMVVLVEGGGEGSSSAVPATKKVYEWYFDKDRK